MDVWKLYGTILRGLLALAAAGYLTSRDVRHAATMSANDLRHGLVSLKALNHQLGM